MGDEEFRNAAGRLAQLLLEEIRRAVREELRAVLPAKAAPPPPAPPTAHMGFSEDRLIRPKEAARMMGVGKTRFFELAAAGEIATFKVGRATMIETAEVRRWVERQKAAGHA